MTPISLDSGPVPGWRVAPATRFDPLTFKARVAFNLDRIVTDTGMPTGSSNHPLIGPVAQSLRADTPNPNMAGPLGGSLVRRLTDPDTGIVLDVWLDADGIEQRTPPPAPPQTTK